MFTFVSTHERVNHNCAVEFPFVPSLAGLAFLIQSVKWRTKSKKKSPSGTLITYNA